MLRWLHVFLMIGLFAGLGIRASGAHIDTCSPSEHENACCDAGHSGVEASEHNEDCPPFPHDHDHHHHGECCHSTHVWFVALSGAPALYPPHLLLGSARSGDDKLPDGPVVSLDKPPLI